MGSHTNPYGPRSRTTDRVEDRLDAEPDDRLPDDVVAKLVQAGASTNEVDDLAAGYVRAGPEKIRFLNALRVLSIEETTAALEEARAERAAEREEHVLAREGIELPDDDGTSEGWDDALEDAGAGVELEELEVALGEEADLEGDGTGEPLPGFTEVDIQDDDEDDLTIDPDDYDEVMGEDNDPPVVLEVPDTAEEAAAWIDGDTDRASAAWSAELARKRATGKNPRVTVRRAVEAVLGPQP